VDSSVTGIDVMEGVMLVVGETVSLVIVCGDQIALLRGSAII
jgi:hypothetical protein